MNCLNKINRWISSWEKRGYKDGIPDEADSLLESYGMVPSYRRICQALMKNDLHLISLGFQRHQCDAYIELKRIEIQKRDGKKPRHIQMKLFGGIK